MSRFGDLIGGKTTPPIVVEPEPEIIEGDSDKGQVDLESLSKIELEEFDVVWNKIYKSYWTEDLTYSCCEADKVEQMESSY